MNQDSLLFQAFVFLAAAVIAVPIAARLGLGSVLGYLLAGVAIGPFGFGFIGNDAQDLLHFAEFGVVMMLFVIGLELQPALLWRLRNMLLGMGGMQVGLTTAAAVAIGLAFGQTWQASLAIGLILSLSSTAIVLQSLAERGYMKRDAGQRAFAVLLFQDLAVIPMLAVLPLLATTAVAGSAAGAEHGGGLIESLPAWLRALVVLGAVLLVVVGGRFAVQPLFRAIARTRLREVFTAAALLLVTGIALLMNLVGLSPALGTFLAGVVLATSEFRHELESDIEPFKGLLLGLFFLAVGASIDFALVRSDAMTVSALVAGLVLVKALILFLTGRIFRMGLDQNLLFTAALAQGGEFGFVLLSYAGQNAVLPPSVANVLVAAIALSMATTPLMLVAYERLLAPRFGTRPVATREHDEIDDESAVIIAGFGQFGSTVGRLLRSQGVRPVVLENDSDRVELLRRLGLEVYYGDASRLDLLNSAGIERARVLVMALGDDAKMLALAKVVRERYPNVRILARAVTRSGAFDLLQAGVSDVYRDTLDTALRVGEDALSALGTPRHQAHRLAQAFRRHDERHVRDLATSRLEWGTYVDRVRVNIRALEADLQREFGAAAEPVRDAAWDSSTLRAEAGASTRHDTSTS